jgi:hypothetical protein
MLVGSWASASMVRNDQDLRQALTQLESRSSHADQHSVSAQKTLLQGGAPARRFLTQLEESFHTGLESRRVALGQLAADQVYASSYVVLEKAFLIWATPSNMLVDSLADAFNNFAKIERRNSSSGRDELNFYFLWENPRDEHSVINIECSVGVRGVCTASADSGFLSGGSSSLTIRAELQPLEWWNQPPTTPLQQSSQIQDVVTISSSGGIFWGLGRRIIGIETPSLIVSSQYDLQHTLFAVPPRGVVVLKVTVSLDYSVDDGSIEVDFSRDDFSLRCPFVLLGILTPVAPIRATMSG